MQAFFLYLLMLPAQIQQHQNFPPSAWNTSSALSARITVVVAYASQLVRRALRRWPITSCRRVRMISGIKAKGSAKLSTTWESTRIFSGSRPIAITAMAGIMVSRRRRTIGHLISRKPSMMTCPAMVLTVEDGNRHNDHGGINQPGAVHGRQHVPQFVTHVAHAMYGAVGRALLLLFDPVLHQRRVQVHHVRHHGGAQHAHGNVNAG